MYVNAEIGVGTCPLGKDFVEIGAPRCYPVLQLSDLQRRESASQTGFSGVKSKEKPSRGQV